MLLLLPLVTPVGYTAVIVDAPGWLGRAVFNPALLFKFGDVEHLGIHLVVEHFGGAFVFWLVDSPLSVPHPAFFGAAQRDLIANNRFQSMVNPVFHLVRVCDWDLLFNDWRWWVLVRVGGPAFHPVLEDSDDLEGCNLIARLSC